MITFQSIMFVSLGFLTAVLLGFVAAPAFWARAVRLTSERMRASLPLTEREIRAEHNRLRAENAIRIYRLSADRDKARLAEARQQVEVNRRDASISDLERRLRRFEAENEASENARRVLEATLKERMPELEKRLVEARQLLAHRDGEMKALREDAGKTLRALDEAMQANAQQRGEIDRLRMSLATQTGRPASPPQGAETETALRSELEGLRARSRDQAELIKRLQKMVKSGAEQGEGRPAAGVSEEEERRVAELAAVQEGLEASREALLAQVKTLSEKVEAQAGEIALLKRQVTEADAAGRGRGRKRGVAAGEKISAETQAAAAKDDELAERDKTIAGLRRELAMANERLARQASYYMEELRRLGSGGGARAGRRGGASVAERLSGKSGAGPEDAVTGEAPAPTSRESNGKAAAREAGEAQVAEAAAGQAEDVASPEREGASLEARLAEAETGRDGVAQQGDGVLEVEEKPRPKLVDRIAGISKR